MNLPFIIHLLYGLPVYDQIVKSVKRAVLTGELVPGTHFPSVRVLALELKISPTTAHRAVLELRDSGFLATRPGAGMVVVKPPGSSQEHLIAQLAPACRHLVRQASQLGLSPADILVALQRTFSESIADSQAAPAPPPEELPGDEDRTGVALAADPEISSLNGVQLLSNTE